MVWRIDPTGWGENETVGTSSVSKWTVLHRHGSAQELHDRAADDPIDRRAVVVHHVDRTALVLGSTQPDADLDLGVVADRGWELARRRSGGGAVLLVPGEHVWVDVVLPAGDPLADDDVERATWWLGHAWARALRLELVAEGAGGLSADASAVPVGTPASGQAASGQAASGPAVLHQRGVSDRVAGRVACFAALGPGELSVDGRKVLGISQRRTRFGARFQCIAYSRWEPELLLGALRATAGAGLGSAGGAEWGGGADRPGGVEWGGESLGASIRTALVDRAGAVVPSGWDVVERLVPALP